MKIDFYAPKKYYGTHALGICGWIILFLYEIFSPIGKTQCLEGYFVFILFLYNAVFVGLGCVVVIYVMDLIFKFKLKNYFMLKNIFYDIFLDIGFVLNFIPLFWWCDTEIKDLLPLLILFIFIRLLKYVQRKMEKRCKNEN